MSVSANGSEHYWENDDYGLFAPVTGDERFYPLLFSAAIVRVFRVFGRSAGESANVVHATHPGFCTLRAIPILTRMVLSGHPWPASAYFCCRTKGI